MEAKTMIVLDSSAVIAFFEGKEQIQEMLQNSEAAISTISIHEVLLGMQSKNDQDSFLGFLQSVKVLQFDLKDAQQSASLEKIMMSKGRPIGKLDMMIAATCIANNLPLVTLDNDFKRVEGLNVTVIENK